MFFSHVPRITQPRFLGQTVCPVACEQTDTKVTTVGTLSGFQEFFLQPIIKDRPNNSPEPIVNYKRNNEQSSYSGFIQLLFAAVFAYTGCGEWARVLTMMCWEEFPDHWDGSVTWSSGIDSTSAGRHLTTDFISWHIFHSHNNIGQTIATDWVYEVVHF